MKKFRKFEERENQSITAYNKIFELFIFSETNESSFWEN